MANQAGRDVASESGPVEGVALSAAHPDAQDTETPGYTVDPGHGHASFHGRPISWVAVSLIMGGFLIGALALVLGPTWIMFWIGGGVVVVGAFMAATTNLFNDWY